MAKNERMKNGLDMLFEDNFHDEESGEGGGVQTMRISLIEPDKNQPSGCASFRKTSLSTAFCSLYW